MILAYFVLRHDPKNTAKHVFDHYRALRRQKVVMLDNVIPDLIGD